MLVFFSTTVSACSCLAPGTLLEELNKSDAVFVGKVIDIKSSSMQREITFERTKIWKGPESVQLVVVTGTNSASCGYGFEEDKEYLVYASLSEGKYYTDLCSGTKPLFLAVQEDIKVLNEPIIATPNPTSDNAFSKFWSWIKNLFS